MAKAHDRVELKKDGCHYFLGHREVTREEYEAVYPLPLDGGLMPGKAVTTWRKPVKSIAMMVHPDQIEEAKAEDQKRGVSVEYTPQGEPVYRERSTRKAHMRAYGRIDRDSYTGY